MKIGSLFAGIGGFDLAARWMGWETKWYSEIDPYACRVMERNFPEAKNVGDITEWRPDGNDGIDLICGGFPCQPVSLAGQGLAQEDERWLWPEFARVLGVLRPRYVVIENVPGLRSRGMDDVLRDLAKIGYDAEWTSLSAADVGAPHKRERVWIVAHPSGDRRQPLHWWGALPNQVGDGASSLRRPQQQPGFGGNGTVADALPTGLSQPTLPRVKVFRGTPGPPKGREFSRGTTASGDNWTTEPDVGRVAHGVPARVDRLKCLGNAIVPQCAYEIFQRIEKIVKTRNGK